MNDEQGKFTRRGQQFAGLFVLFMSLLFVIWTWYTALFNGYFYKFASMIFPAFLFVGLGLILFPDYKTERIARGEDISQLSGLGLLTPRWWTILIVGLTSGVGNFFLLALLGG